MSSQADTADDVPTSGSCLVGDTFLVVAITSRHPKDCGSTKVMIYIIIDTKAYQTGMLSEENIRQRNIIILDVHSARHEGPRSCLIGWAIIFASLNGKASQRAL